VSEQEKYTPRLLEKYQKEIVAQLKADLGYKNIMEVPKLEKITVSVGVGDAKDEPNYLKTVLEELSLIAGQSPVVTKSKKAISNFKIRQGDPVGCFVNLRREKMYEFFDRLINIVLPRVKDFSGVSDRSFDGNGNFSLGVKEHIIFPEINYENVDQVHGLNITITTTAKTDKEAYELLKSFGFPFKKKIKN
jgi:large subunit ribosomal protein L5